MALIYSIPKRYARLTSPLDDDVPAEDDYLDEIRLTRSRIRQRSRVMGYYPRTYIPSYSSYFDDKYSFIMNSYQPTLDYLRRRTQDIQTRINDLTYLSKYQPNRILPHSYSPSLEEINRLSRSEAARAEQNILHHHVMSRSPFRFAKTATSAHIFRHLHPYDSDDIIEREKHHQIERDNDIAWTARNDFLRLNKRRINNIPASYDDSEISYDLKRALRGQSPNTIADLLLADSEKRIQQGRKKQNEYVQKAIKELHSNYRSNRSIRSISRDNDAFYMPRRYHRIF